MTEPKRFCMKKAGRMTVQSRPEAASSTSDRACRRPLRERVHTPEGLVERGG
ncbi:hypothetical protein ABZ912_41605 [Nonomuraea angiospora]|uniref:hypothetical protein n=1 Tax=Nonomuraea angiospora TaxID=46172 RepID=UPI0033EB4022